MFTAVFADRLDTFRLELFLGHLSGVEPMLASHCLDQVRLDMEQYLWVPVTGVRGVLGVVDKFNCICLNVFEVRNEAKV